MTTATLRCQQCFLNYMKTFSAPRQVVANRRAAFSVQTTDDGFTNTNEESLIKKAKQRLRTKKPTTKSTKQKVSNKKYVTTLNELVYKWK